MMVSRVSNKGFWQARIFIGPFRETSMPPVKRTVREVLPEITWNKIAQPYPDYPYFQGIGAYPFRPEPARGKQKP